MLTVVCVVVGLIVVGLAALLFAAVKAPLGYQDEKGFHFGPPQAVSADGFERGRAARIQMGARREKDFVRPVGTKEWRGPAVTTAVPSSH